MEFVSRLIRAGQLAGVSCALATGLSAVSRTFPDQIEFKLNMMVRF